MAFLSWTLRLSILISSPIISQVAANADFVVKFMTHGTMFLWNSIVSTSG